MRKSTTLSVILAAALSSAVAFAAPQGGGFGGPGGPHHGPHGHGGFLHLQGLNLTDAQKASVKSIEQQSFSSLKSQFQAVRQQREAFEALAPNSSGYQAAAASLAQAEASLTQARIVAQATATAQVYSTVLTSAQQSQMATQKAAFEARKAQWQQFKAEHPTTSTSTAQ